MAGSGIVLEPLTKDNYENWSTLVKNYLMGKNLWNVVKSGPQTADEQSSETWEIWEMKNAKALHIIQLACGSQNLTRIRQVESAKEAWTQLSILCSDLRADSHILRGVVEDSLGLHKQLHMFILSGDWRSAKGYLDNDHEAVYSKSEWHRTALHTAVIAGHENIVRELVKIGKWRLIKIQDKYGYTALALAAELTGNTEIAKYIIKEGTGQEAQELLCMKNIKTDEIPVLLAAAKAHKTMTTYLYARTPWTELEAGNFRNSVLLLTRCITAEIFDVALNILQRAPNIRLAFDHGPGSPNLQPLYALASKPSAFPSGSGLGLGQQFIYNILILKDNNEDDFLKVIVPDVAEEEGQRFTGGFCGRVLNFALIKLLGRVLLSFWMFVQNSILLGWIWKTYNQKKTHLLVREILGRLCKRVQELNETELQEALAYHAMLKAAEFGIIEFVVQMSRANPNLLWAIDKNKRGVFSHAVMNRRRDVFQLIHDAKVNGRKDLTGGRADVFGNTILHSAAYLGPSSSLDLRSGPALQMQREVLWFKAVESIVHPKCKEAKNADGKKPREIFTESHKKLLEAGEKWAKDTAGQFMLVGTLIITIMFAAAFTVPGGNNQDTGVPLFLRDKIFSVFIISDAVSLFTSSASVLLFIGILTSRYAEEDFHKSLPWKLFFSIFFLFLSVLSMIVAFCAVLAMILKDHQKIKTVAISLSAVPLIVLVPSQLRLFLEIFNSTVRSRL